MSFFTPIEPDMSKFDINQKQPEWRKDKWVHGENGEWNVGSLIKDAFMSEFPLGVTELSPTGSFKEIR